MVLDVIILIILIILVLINGLPDYLVVRPRDKPSKQAQTTEFFPNTAIYAPGPLRYSTAGPHP